VAKRQRLGGEAGGVEGAGAVELLLADAA